MLSHKKTARHAVIQQVSASALLEMVQLVENKQVLDLNIISSEGKAWSPNNSHPSYSWLSELQAQKSGPVWECLFPRLIQVLLT